MEVLRLSSSTAVFRNVLGFSSEYVCGEQKKKKEGFLVSRKDETQRLWSSSLSSSSSSSSSSSLCVERKLRIQGRKQGTVRRSLGNARASVAEKVASVDELVLKPIRVIHGKIKLPGSKSLSNRILLLAALSEVCSQIFFSPPFTFTVQSLPICRLLARKENSHVLKIPNPSLAAICMSLLAKFR